MTTARLTRRRKLKFLLLRTLFPFRRVLALTFLRSQEFARSLVGWRERTAVIDGLPLPPRRMRVLVSGTADAQRFLESGRLTAQYLRDLLADSGTPMEQMGTILDLGCGCGRIARWYATVDGPRLKGCDYNGTLVDWCAANLRFMDVERNQLQPPLPYGSASFDFVYMLSVFTHLSTEAAQRWVAEVARVVKPGGLFWFTIHGDSYRERLPPADQERFDAGEIVVWLPEIEGTNLCAAYWPESAVRRMFGDQFQLLHHYDPRTSPAGEVTAIDHDAYLLRRS